MKSTAAVTIPGVLMKIVTSAPVYEGLKLYHGLCESFNVVLLTDDDKESTDHWLSLEGLDKHGIVLYGEGTNESGARLSQVNSLRLRGFAVDLCFEPDPAIAAQLLANGYTVCNFLHRAYSYPSWRPDFEEKTRPWEELAKQAERDRILKAMDKRITE
jgi:hypothetical protein